MLPFGDDNGISSMDFLTNELSTVEKALEETERKLKQHNEASDKEGGTDKRKSQHLPSSSLSSSILERLTKLGHSVESLRLAQEISEWKQALSKPGENSNMLLHDTKCCNTLALILIRHDDSFEACPSLYEEYYLPLYEYVQESLRLSIRQELERARYPSSKGCTKLVQECQQQQASSSMLAQVCTWLTQLQSNHSILVEKSLGTLSSASNKSMVLIELFRPLVTRIKFHFVDPSNDRPTSTRIDRLPEWLCTYIREHVLEGSGTPWKLIQSLVALEQQQQQQQQQPSPPKENDDTINTKTNTKTNTNTNTNTNTMHLYKLDQQNNCNLPIEFLNELVRLIQWVLTKRNFFRHERICGPKSNPLLLCNAIEQLLQFDILLQGLVQSTLPKGMEWQPQGERLLGLFECVVESDEDLLKWWIQRERETALSTLFADDDDDNNNENDSTTTMSKTAASWIQNHVSSRAELFCALIRSVQCKASILAVPEPYLRNVAVPLCIQFVDALQDTLNELKHDLVQKRRGLPNEVEFSANVHHWIELLNGTHLAASALLKEDAWLDGVTTATTVTATSSQSDHDLARFGQALERLETVLIEDFASAFVETILLERAKLASYLMMASHLLASETWESDETDLSNELKETNAVLAQFHHVCNVVIGSATNVPDIDMHDENTDNNRIASFAPLAMREHVMTRLAEKFLEVALDIHDVTPDMWHDGALVFARDVKVIMGNSSYPEVLRLLDVTRLLSMDSKSLKGLQSALSGLVSASTYLHPHDFMSDTTIYNEAMSMVKVTGFSFLHLDDVISVLNRRRDLTAPEEA